MKEERKGEVEAGWFGRLKFVRKGEGVGIVDDDILRVCACPL